MKFNKLNKRIHVSLMVMIIIVSSGCISTCKKGDDYCLSKYPVLLVHGVAFRDETLGLKYWGSIPSSLEKKGAKVFKGNQQAYGTIKSNAKQLKARVEEILKITGSDKVNIIAHSRGGLESRYMISMLGMEDKVASLTTLATPHRGSSMADYIIKHTADKKMLAVIIDFYAKIIGDSSPESLNAAIELTTYRMKMFNDTVKDSGKVYYQSYTGAIDKKYFNLLWRAVYKIIDEKEGPNDGLVSVASAKWGSFKGVVNCDGKPLVTHADIVGLHILSGKECFDADEFFIEIVHNLKAAGF